MANQKIKSSSYMGGRELLTKISQGLGDTRLMLIFGNEDYIIDGAITQIKKQFISPGGEDMDYTVLSKENFSFDNVREYMETPPWLSEKRVVLVRNTGVFSKEDTKTGKTLEEQAQFLKNIPDTSLVIFVEENPDKRKKLFKFFASNGLVSEINHMEELELCKWAAGKLTKEGIKITEAAAQSLVSRCDSSMRKINNEIIKLSLYCKGQEIEMIDIKTVELVCPPDIKGSVFTITDAVGSSDAASALLTLNSLIILKEPVIVIRVQLMRHIKNLIIAKELGNSSVLVKRTGMHPFVAGKVVKQASFFTMDQLLNLYHYAVSQDSKIKHGEIDERCSLENMIVMAAERK